MRHFIVISQQRSGSHMLMNMLNSHPLVHCNSDLMTEDTNRHGAGWAFREGLHLPPKYPERSPLPPGKKPELVGFLVKLKQNLHQHFRDRAEMKFILLHRKNRLATMLSYILCGKLGAYPDEVGLTTEQGAEQRQKQKPMKIAPRKAEEFFEQWSAKTDEAVRCLEGMDWMQVHYEDLHADPEAAMRAVFEHLGVPWHDIGFGQGRGSVKLDPRPLDQAIKNYGQLKDHFADTRWESFFTEGR